MKEHGLELIVAQIKNGRKIRNTSKNNKKKIIRKELLCKFCAKKNHGTFNMRRHIENKHSVHTERPQNPHTNWKKEMANKWSQAI